MFAATNGGIGPFDDLDEDFDDKPKKDNKETTNVTAMGGGFISMTGNSDSDDSDVDRPPLSEADLRKKANK